MTDASTQPLQATWRNHAINIALLLLVIVALYWRVFFLGDTIIDVNTLNNQLPWGYDAAETVNHPYNRRDPTDMYLTREYFIVAAYQDGELPLWNPYTMAGHPIYADGVTRIFSPSLVVYAFLDLPLGYSVARLFELMLGAIFMYLFLIAIGVTARAALMGALVFELSAHSLFHLTGLGWWGGLMWLPLIFLYVDRAITRRSFSQAIIAGIVIALQFFCAYMPNQIYYIGAVALYFLLFGWRSRTLLNLESAKKLNVIRLFLLMTVTLITGLALAATQWLPVVELLGYSNRRIVPTETGFIYLPPWYLVTLIFPNLFGTAYDPKMVTLFTALNVSHDHSLYLGIAALLPLGLLFYSQRKRWRKLFAWLPRMQKNHQPKETTAPAAELITTKQAAASLATASDKQGETQTLAVQPSYSETLVQHRISFFMFLLVLALVVMMAAPLYVHLTQFVPVLRSIRVIVRAGVLFLFAASVLVGFGADLLLKASADELKKFHRLVKKILLAILAFVIIAAIVSWLVKLSGFIANANIEYVAGSGRLAYLRSVAVAMTAQFTRPSASVLWPLLVVSAVYLLWHWLNQNRINRNLFFTLLVALLIGDLYLNSQQFDKTHDRKRVFPITAITEKLKALPAGRLLVAPSGLATNRRARDTSREAKIIAPPNTLLPYQIPTVTGKDQLFPKAYREFCALIEAQNQLSHVVFETTESPFFDALNVKYLLTYAAAEVSSSYELLMKADGLALYENRHALPRAFFVQQVMDGGVPSGVADLERLRQADFDIKTTAVVQGAKLSTQTCSVGKATISEDRRNRVVIETENAGDGWLVLSDNFYPGWQAEIDGKPVEIFHANHTMRAVSVPAGSHVLSFRFAPRVFRASVYLSITAAIGVFAALLILRIRRRK
ncbi:MAG: YfhO family protein [Acidobacteria bacterium]|nr:YfhO family protein [Acidobacteriota bacterium]